MDYVNHLELKVEQQAKTISEQAIRIKELEKREVEQSKAAKA